MRFMSYKRISHYKWLILLMILFSSVVFAGWFTTGYLGDRARQEIFKENEATSLLLTTQLTKELNKIEGAVKAMSGSPWIVSALMTRRDHDISQANSALDRYSSALDVSVSYLMDAHGMTIASSNWNDPDSFIGKDYRFRPYFTQAMKGNPGRYFALGVTSMKRGFYASFPVKDGKNRIIGVIAMKKNLDDMELQLKNYPYCFVVNPYGIIFLSSKADMIMKSLWPISQAVERELLATRQFGDNPFDTIMPREIIDREEISLQGKTYLASRNVIDHEGWSIVIMTQTDRITIYQSVGVILTMVVCLLIAIPFAVTYRTIRSAEDVRRSEERFQQVAESSQDWIWETDRDGQYIFSSQAIRQILGYEPEEIVGKHYYDFYIPEEREKHRHKLKGFLDNDEAFFRIISRRLHRDGRQIYIESTGLPLVNAEGQTIGYRGTNRDITERIRAEEKLRESEADFRRIFDQSPIGAVVVSTDYRFKRVNEAMCRMMGYTEEEFTTLKFTDITHPDHLTADIEQVKRLTSGEIDEYTTEKRYIRKDNNVIWGRLSVRAIRDSAGNLLHILPFIVDITDRKKAEEEKEKLEKGLLHAQKMEAIGTLAGGIAHDINNLLMGIQGYASLMLLDTNVDDPHYRKLKSIEEQVKSGADLTGQLLGFARGGRYEVKPTDLNEVVKKTSTMFGRTRKEITIHQKYKEDLWPVEVDRGQIEQVLLNLYVNAWQAMPGGGNIYLETANIVLDDNYVKAAFIKPGKYVRISVTDTGIGMDEKTRARIFEPFFTTKEMGRGTGLGLATVYGIVKGHKGIINVYSEINHGTTFTIYLPASEKEVVQGKSISDTRLTGKETILVIDDEKTIIEVTKEILESLGYTVLTAASGREAVDVYSRNKEKIDCVILDMIMPDMGGGETFDYLKEMNPNVKVILSSGYSLNGQAIRIMEKGCYAFIQKPFTVMSLSKKVRDVLEGKM